MAKHSFQTEINELLDLMIHSLYSNREIFLRELISNASDALDKLNYLILTEDKFKDMEFSPRIDLSFDLDKKTLTIKDNGIGMDEQDLIHHLGTIAKSGTKSFLNSLSGDKKKDSALIGQFGVGFYSAFMVSDKIVVQTKKIGTNQGYSWISDGRGEYEIGECVRESQGTEITLYLKDEDKSFASRWKIESIVKKYSEHIAFPIFLSYEESVSPGEGEDKEEKKESKCEQINKAKAIWRLAKSELKKNDYEEFYKGFSGDSQPPLSYVHSIAEGNLQYRTLFFIPSKAPFDLNRVDYKSGVKLYVKRVFITEDDKELLPSYLRFIKGVIDSEDLPLNVSREILQQNRILANIKSASVKKILAEIKKLSADSSKYEIFYKEFGKTLKEGLYHDFENKDAILELLRFSTTKNRDGRSLKQYKEEMKEGQKSIYYLLGDRLDLLESSPLLEKYAKKEYEVLLLGDEVDAFVIPGVGEYEGVSLKNASSKEALGELGEQEISKEDRESFKVLADVFKQEGGEDIEEVTLTLTLDSPLALVGKEQNPMLENLMRQMGENAPKNLKNVELNIAHPLIEKLRDCDESRQKQMARLLLHSARLLESGSLQNAKEFTQEVFELIQRDLHTA